MSVVIETTLGDLTVDLFLKERPKTCLNFLKLCKTKAYNCSLFHTVQPGFVAQTGGSTGPWWRWWVWFGVEVVLQIE